MTSGLPGSLLFAAHLLSVLAAAGAALAFFLERDRGRAARLAGLLGFGALAVVEGLHGAGVTVETSAAAASVRTAAYVGILLWAVLPMQARGAAAIVAIPGGALTPALAAALAGLVGAIRRGIRRGGLWVGVGLLLLAAAEAVLEMRGRPWVTQASHGLRIAGYASISRTAILLTRHSIRFRFIVGFSVLLVAVVLFVSAAIGTVIDRNLRQGAIDRVLSQAEAGRDRMRELAFESINELLTVTRFNPDLRRALEAGGSIPSKDLEEIRRGFLPDVDFLILVDAGGGILGQTEGVEDDDAVSFTGGPVFGFSLKERQPTASLEQAIDGSLALLGVAPVLPPESAVRNPIGYAVAGFNVDEELLQREVIRGNTRAVILQGRRGQPPLSVASAGFGRTPLELGERTGEALGEAYLGFLDGAEPVGRTLSLAGEDHFSAVMPLTFPGLTPVAMLVVAEPGEVVAATQRQVNQVLFFVTVGVIMLSFVLALFAAGRITRPLIALTAAARRVQTGDLDTKADVAGEDEVADLATAFNHMTSSVNAMTEELRLAATEQSRLRARLETVVNSMGDGLIAVDQDGRVVTYNPAAGTIVGAPRSRVVGRMLREVLSGRNEAGNPIDQDAWPEVSLAFLDRPDGAEAPVAISSAPLRDASDNMLGRVYVLRDMSRDYEVDRMKREFLSNVSHELRTPLTPIIGYSEIMTRRKIPTAKARDFAANILDSARRLERIVAMLVDFSAIEAGRMTVDLQPTALGPLVKRSVGEWKERASGHRFVVRAPRQLPAALVSPELFRRMLAELLDNAVKYSPQGGRIRVAVEEATLDGRRMLEVSVADQGIGIEPDDLARIFQDFRQVDASDTRAFGGLGLGLTFVTRLVEAHGGSMTAESRPGKGSIFRFTVPAEESGRRRAA